MPDNPALIAEVAKNTAALEGLQTLVTTLDANAERRMAALESAVKEQGTTQQDQKTRVTKLELIVFGIGGPAALAAFGSLLKLVLGR